MKRFFAGLLLLSITASASAATVYDQLCGFNFNWKKYYMQAPTGPAQNFSGDRELIQAHLSNVLNVLRAAPVDALTADQRTSRMHMIALLDGYRIAGNFPLNYYRSERIPVFIDEHGTHCAVGYLMMMTGQEEMAQRISRADNYVWVKDLNDAGVPAWQKASGLSFEELALIQGAYDNYPENGFTLANKYELPQQPTCTTAYFTGRISQRPNPTKKYVWCQGEGKDGVLNGRWEQNYSEGLPWIVGYFTNGKRSGQWQEYYQGTTILCRTERWCENKLNGTRTRYDMAGNIVEEILFNDGAAVSKINYDLHDSLAYVRIPQDSSNRVLTQVYNWEGQLIACGHETVYNPGNLQWFQNIELTALNSAQVTARNNSEGNNPGLNSDQEYLIPNMYNSPPLVQYKKEGDWMYFRENAPQGFALKSYDSELQAELYQHYRHLGPTLYASIAMYANIPTGAGFDSIRVSYEDNYLKDFYGCSNTNYVHLYFDYYKQDNSFTAWDHGWYVGYISEVIMRPKESGQLNRQGQRIGEWKYYRNDGVLFKTETYLVPTNEEETVIK